MENMAQRLKQSEGSATDSAHSIFFWARLKLTATYVTILAIILFGFSIFLLQSVERNLADASDEDFTDVESHHRFVQNTLSNVQNEILLIDLIILSLAAGASYSFAGYTLRPIRQSLEAQRVFSEHASHELRTPLAVIKNDAEVLLRNVNPTKENIHSTLHSIVEEIDRMTFMTRDLLMLARSERTKTDFETIDLVHIVRQVIERMRPLAGAKNISMTLNSPDAIKVQGGANALERIIMNLLQNAIQHTDMGGSISTALSVNDSHVNLEVQDTGEGIAEKHLPHVFKRFYKGDDSVGTGLGLSIVKELVSQHSGEIRIKSTLGKGTTAEVTLPLVK